MSLLDLNKKPKRGLDFNSSIDYLLGEKPNKPRIKAKQKKTGPRVEIIKYHVELTNTEKLVLAIEAILIIWFVLAKLKIVPIF